jgi:hypothetical protein
MPSLTKQQDLALFLELPLIILQLFIYRIAPILTAPLLNTSLRASERRTDSLRI